MFIIIALLQWLITYLVLYGYTQNQLDSVQQDLGQRCQMLDALAAKENDQLEHLEMVKGMIHTLTQGLSQREREVRCNILSWHLFITRVFFFQRGSKIRIKIILVTSYRNNS